jgi:type VI secretion system VasD/TssJ family lipoprotein
MTDGLERKQALMRNGVPAGLRRVLVSAGLLALVALPAGCASCGKDEPPPPAPAAPGEPPPREEAQPPPAERPVCLELTASPELNLYDGAAHALVVQIYPLRDGWGFERLSVDDLLSGKSFEGSLGTPMTLQVLPGEVVQLERIFPGPTSRVGFVADYYRAGADPEGTRKVTTPAGCGSDAARVFLGPKDLSGLGAPRSDSAVED